MSVEHMALVFAAGGLKAPQKALLLALTNRTDAHGYCHPGRERLSDESGLSLASYKRVRAELIELKLLKTAVRTETTKSGSKRQTTNLFRVNLALLRKMARPERNYDDNLMQTLGFDDEDAQETPVPAPAGGLRLSRGGAQVEPQSIS